MSVLDGLFLLLVSAHTILAASSSTAFIPQTPSPSTCPSRTANYLTHTLPQQCLTSSSIRVGASSAGNATSVNTISTDTIISVTRPESSVTSESTSLASIALLNPVLSNAVDTVTTVSDESPTLVPVASVSTVIATPVLPDNSDEDSPLESNNFLSFEEWKKRNLIKTGQGDHVARDAQSKAREARNRPIGGINYLESLGDDGEIDLDFSGLVPDGPESAANQQTEQHHSTGAEGVAEPVTRPKSRPGNKDAGTTSKARFNYASFDCAANILKTNSQAKNPVAVLGENKDSYMLNECSANNKFLILELCDDVSIDTIVLANFEFFSSIFRLFRVSVSDRYPVKLDKWKTLGTFEARNTREVQAFLVENPVIWARYVRIEFLTHYGSEFYCPVSLVRVHGTTPMEEYKYGLETNMGEDDDDSDSVVDSVSLGENDDALLPEAVDEILLIGQAPDTSEDANVKSTIQEAEQKQTAHHGTTYVPDFSTRSEGNAASVTMNEVCLVYPPFDYASEICLEDPASQHPSNIGASGPWSNTGAQNTSTVPRVSTSTSSSASEQSTQSTPDPQTKSQASTETRQQIDQSLSLSAGSGTKTPMSGKGDTERSKLSAAHSDSLKDRVQAGNRTRHAPASTADRSKQLPSGTQPPPAGPTMQESFFKSVQKRLQMLESNSSLSLQYVEEQSRALRDAFRKVEQRQLSKTSTFLDQLNKTVLNELREFRQQYDHLWQSTVIELEMQREQYQRENLAMHARLGILADELIFQKRMSILQTVLIIVCFGLVLFSRGSIHNYMELPLVQNVLSRSPSARWSNLSLTGVDTPRATPEMKRMRSASQLGSRSGILKTHRRAQSEESLPDAPSPAAYAPATPISIDGFSDGEQIKEESGPDDPQFDPSSIERPSTSPPMLSSSAPSTPPYGVFHEESIETRMLNGGAVAGRDKRPPQVRTERPATPAKHLTWKLPDSS